QHHCRRCGGIFCGSCTQQRMILRGQGDSPVRICEPCKRLEEATRFEMRHRHKNKASKGGSGASSGKEDDILSESLGRDEKDLLTDKTSVGSSSNSRLVQLEVGNSEQTPSTDHSSAEFESDPPERLRENALAEKKKYRLLKDEGKSEEALRAYKKGKELERQAAALELSLRKNRHKASTSTTPNETRDIKDHFRAASEKLKPRAEKIRQNDDLSAELRDLGWSDIDLHVNERKPGTLSLESELSSLLKDSDGPKNLKPVTSPDKSQVLAHKKKALELKRAGNLAEAKEELKKAKILERKIEEEEILGNGDDDSDDELLKMIHRMDTDEHDKISSVNKPDIGIEYPSLGDDFDLDGNFEVTDEDMDDPEMASALKSLGWVEESPANLDEVLNQKRIGRTAKDTVSLNKAAEEVEDEGHQVVNQGRRESAAKSKPTVQKELIALKKKALALRREGRLDESEIELKKAKVVEAELEEMTKTGKEIHDEEEEVTDQDLQDPAYLSLLKNLGWQEEEEESTPQNSKLKNSASKSTSVPRKGKRELERELLLLKRKALSLRRQGDTEAADEALNEANSLEEEYSSLREDSEPAHLPQFQQGQKSTSPHPAADEIMQHKRKALALKREGKLNEAKEELRLAKLLEKESSPSSSSSSTVVDNVEPSSSSNNKSLSSRERFKLQQESLGHKRQALKLRREGKTAEAEAELELARSLESQLQEIDPSPSLADDVGVEDFMDPQLLSALNSIGFEATTAADNRRGAGEEQSELIERIKAEKLKAVKLKRAGNQAEALDSLRRAKLLEKKL
ncbi:hypothetical protein M569_07719, partial [Genlisea aurea]